MLIFHTPLPNTPERQHWLKRSLAATLLVAVMASPVLAMAAPSSNGIQIKGGVSVGVNGEDSLPSLSFRDAEISDVLYTLAEQGNFNLIVDKSVEGTISLDLKDISINKVLEYVMTIANLTYYKDGSTLIITSTQDANSKSLNRLMLKSIPVKYNDAATTAQFLNSTIFSIPRAGGNSSALAAADQRTNSILIMGNDQDVELAKRALSELDFALTRKTYFLKYATASQVAQAISQTLYSTNLVLLSGNNSGGSGNSGGGGSSAIGGGSSSGAGGSNTGGGSTAGGSSSGGGNMLGGATTGGSTTGGSSTAGGGTTTTTGGGGGGSTASTGTMVQAFRGGPLTFVNNSANNTMTLIGTAEQIALAEGMLYDLDIRPAQVAVEVSILSLEETRNKGFTPGINNNQGGALNRRPGTGGGAFQVPGGMFNFSGGATFISWDKTLGSRSGKLLDNLSLQSILNNSKAKTLANPTMLTLSGQPATLTSTRTVVTGITTTTNATGVSQTTISTTPVGVSLSLTPTVYNDGTIGMQISPTISDATKGPTIQTGGDSNDISLTSSTSLTIGQTRVKDGETIILAGFIQEKASYSNSPVPFLGNVPILGGLFRTGNSSTTTRNELVMLVTPHIIKEDGVPYFRKEWHDQISYGQYHSDTNAIETAGSSSPSTIIPAANTAGPGENTQGLQTLEHRPSDLPKTGNRANNLPLSTFSEVLK